MSRRDPDPYGIQNSELERTPYCAACGVETRTIHLIMCPGACARLFCARDLAEHICETPATAVVEISGPGDIRAMQLALSLLTKRGLR